MDVKLAEKNRQKQIFELEEWCEKAYHSARLYKERTKRWHDHRIQQKRIQGGRQGHIVQLSSQTLRLKKATRQMGRTIHRRQLINTWHDYHSG
jgi:hypothetical protein